MKETCYPMKRKNLLTCSPMKRKSLLTSSLMGRKDLLLAAAVFLLSIMLFPKTARANYVTYGTYQVRVSDGYLALRSAPAYDYSNEKGKLYTGDSVEVVEPSNTQYAYVYSPKYCMYGYVDSGYLIAAPSSYTYSGGYNTMTVSVSSGYLALRTWKEYNYANEIGRLYSGDTVELLDSSDSQYWYVYATRLGSYGYVDKNYLYYTYNPSPNYNGYSTMTVSVASGYLALRNAKAYDAGNEIGKLYTGDVVSVIDTADPTYWYVYSPKLGRYGFVNREYLYGSITRYSSSRWTVRINSGYLALRNAKAYDSRNEIGQLYTGDTVELIDSSDPEYWYVYAYKYGLYGFVNRNYLY